MLEAGLIRTTLGATATDALKKDYRHKQAPRERALAERKQAAQAERTEQRQAAEAEERKEALRMEFEARLIDEAIAGLSDTDRRRLEEEFVAGLNSREIPGALVVLESYRKSGFESAGVRGAFRAFQRQQLLKNRKHDAEAFQRFAQEREVQSVGQEVAKT